MYNSSSVEHKFQAAKASNEEDRKRILEASSPFEAKKMARRIKINVEEWELKKDIVMENLLREKFSNPNLKFLLLETKDRILIEGNTWGDTYWGCCNGQGLNKLGNLLMKIRSELS